MRIQTRLFLGTAALVLALMAVQWWLHVRQLRSIERDLARVATSVGKGILSGDLTVVPEPPGQTEVGPGDAVWVEAARPQTVLESEDSEESTSTAKDVHVVVVPEGSNAKVTRKVERHTTRDQQGDDAEVTVTDTYKWSVDADKVEIIEKGDQPADAEGKGKSQVRQLVLQVETGPTSHQQFLVVSEDDQRLHRIPIPVAPAIDSVRGNMREGAAVGGLLLVAGLFASAVLSRRLTRPLRDLAEGAEALGSGKLGVQVPVSASGEVGDLQRSFNRMSGRLAELEAEKDSWQRREHLAQLGDLSRGLAHTLRNPLHTLGLAVEELASGEGDREGLVATSRAQIRRIDRWLRSFLALGAEEAAETEPVELGDLVKTVALESVQQGAEVRIEGARDELVAQVVPGALRAALANLVENATEASPAGQPVVVGIERRGGEALVTVTDRGPGLSDEVRQRLFSPHVTTKVGGSGMGLFLARQLIVGMHGGRLEVGDGEGGGTVASVYLPLIEGGATPSEQSDG